MAEREKSARRLSLREKRWDWLAWHTPMPPHYRLILLELFRWHIRYPEVFLSGKRLCELALISDKTEREAMKKLQAQGWFRREKRGRGVTGRVYSYTLLFPIWFDADRDVFLLRAERALLQARLDFRLDDERADNGANWTDTPELEARLEVLRKQLESCP